MKNTGIIIVTILCLYVSSLISYLLFHSLIEIITIVIAFALLTLTWNISRFLPSGYLIILGIGYGFIALIDLFHTLTYKGLGIFPGYDANLPTQLWIAARSLQVLLLLAAPFYARRNLNKRMFTGIAVIITASTTALVFFGFFPDCFIEGKGLTQFKIVSEYVITLLLVVALVLINRVSSAFKPKVFTLIVASIICTIVAELAFTSYISVYGPANMVGHFLKFFAFALLYQALVATGLKEPYELIFHDLKEAEQALRHNQEHLEELVHERTTALESTNRSLEFEVSKHRQAREKLSSLNRELLAIRSCNQVLVHAQDEQTLLNEICRIVCNEAGYRMAWVGFALNDEAKTVQPVASGGVDDGYLSNVCISWAADSQYGQGQTGRVIRSGQTGCFQDIATDPLAAPWREHAMRRKYRSSIALPLKDEAGTTFGAFMLYSSEPDAFTDDEVSLLEELASDMAFGIMTLRTRVKHELAQTQYHTIIQTALDGFLFVDTSGRILEANDAYCAMTGYSRDELLAMTLFDVEEALAPEEIERRLPQIIQHGGAHFDSRHRCKDGRSIELDISITYSPDEGGRFFGFLRDITGRKLLEEQLRQSQKMEAIGQLAGGVAHDFNNVLTVIEGYCQLLRTSDNLDEEQREQIEQIFASAEKAAQLTHGLLAFSRKQPLIMRQENLNDVLQHVHKFLARIIGEDISFHSACCGAELPIIADRGQIEQVLINLATNARDAMSGGGTFTVRSDHAALDSSFTDFNNYNLPSGNYALLTVSDTGTGIGKEHIEHIFEPFFTTKEVGKGTGLGMAIIYGIIKQHNGFINVCTEIGQGTTFRIYFPIDEKTTGYHSIKAEPAPPVGGNETILVAEDEPSVRVLVAKVLQSHGYNVIIAEDGVDAVEKFKAHQDIIRLIIMDMIMPKKNGKDAYEEISRIKPDVKLLYSSGYTSDFIEDRGISEGTVGLIMKPVQPMELLRKVREILDK
ncbi:MAG: MASE3 domain-containing protein [Desulfuromonadales bacterium]